MNTSVVGQFLNTDKTLLAHLFDSEQEGVVDRSLVRSEDVLIYHVADPLELLRILLKNRIESATELSPKQSFTLYPQIPDGVTLCTLGECAATYRSGFAIEFDRSEIPGYYVPQSSLFADSRWGQFGGVKGAIELDRVSSLTIRSLSWDLRVEHPVLTARDLHVYAISRNVQAREEFGIGLPVVPGLDKFCDFSPESYQTESARILFDYFSQHIFDLFSGVKHDIGLCG